MESIHESADPALLEDLKAKLEALKSCSEEGCRGAEEPRSSQTLVVTRWRVAQWPPLTTLTTESWAAILS